MKYAYKEEYEHKTPGYELKSDAVPVGEGVGQSRFFYDVREGIYKSNAQAKNRVTLLFAGDLLCQDRISDAYRTENGYDFSAAFAFAAPLLHSVDFAAGNLETVVSHSAPLRGEILSHEGPHYYNSPVQFLSALSAAGFDMLTTESNHKLDAGARGVVETLENLDRLGLIHTGVGAGPEEKSVVVDICGFKVGFTAFGTTYNGMKHNLTPAGETDLLNTHAQNRAKEIYNYLKEQGAEYVVCFPHWGKEYTEELTENQLAFARELTHIGYDLVVGSHPHVVQKFKIVNGKNVVFSLGNFLSSLNLKLKKGVEYSALCLLKLSREEGELQAKVEFIPCRLVKNYRDVPFAVLPVLDGLELSEEKEPRVQKTVRHVAKSLECKPSRIRTSCSLNEQSSAMMEQQNADVSAAVSGLLPVDKQKAEGGDMEIPTRRFWDSFKSYHVEKKNLYKLYADYAELVQVGTVSEVITLPGKVEGLPVRVISGSGKENTTTRLVYLTRRIRQLEKGAFQNFTALESVRMFDRIQSIGEEAFAGCSSLIGLKVPRSVTGIGAGAFRGCCSMTSIKIPPEVTHIADDAFTGCDKLTIYCEENSIADNFAKGHNIRVKYMPLSPITLNVDDEDEEADQSAE